MRKTRKTYLQHVPWLLGNEDTGLSMQNKKKMDLGRRAAHSLQIRVLTVVSATDELFIKRYILTLAEGTGFVKLY